MRATAPTRLNLGHTYRVVGEGLLFEERAAGMSREAFRVKIAEIASQRGWWMKPSRSLYVTVASRHLARAPGG